MANYMMPQLNCIAAGLHLISTGDFSTSNESKAIWSTGYLCLHVSRLEMFTVCMWLV